jgi:hypothetical protein
LTFPAGLSRGFPLERLVELNDSGRRHETHDSAYLF